MYNDPQSTEKDKKSKPDPDPNREKASATDAGTAVTPVQSTSSSDATQEKASDSVLPSPPPLPSVPELPRLANVTTASGQATTTVVGSDRVVTVSSSVTETVSGGGVTTTKAVIDPVTGEVTGVNVVRQEAQQIDKNKLIAQAEKLNLEEIERLQKENRNESPINEGDW